MSYPRGWADFVIPTPFGARVRNALDAEARSVRLSNLVGAGGLWYGFGKLIMEMWVFVYMYSTTHQLSLLQGGRRARGGYVCHADHCNVSIFSYSEYTSKFVQQTFRQRLIELVDQAQHFAALGPSSAGGGGSGDLAQSFREGLDGTERECKTWFLSKSANIDKTVYSIRASPGECATNEEMVRRNR